jgi:hypothetical protein
MELKYPTLETVLADVPAVKDQNLPVNVKRDLIKDLYSNIGEKIFNQPPEQVRWMQGVIDNVMSDKDVDKEWEMIRKGHVEKFVKMMHKLQQPEVAEEFAPEVEAMQGMWERIAEGIIRTKEANQEIDDKTWDFVEDHLMSFVNELSDKLDQKSLPGQDKKLLN